MLIFRDAVAGGRTSAGDRVAENQHPASVRRDGASGRVHIKADRGWTVFEIPSTPGSLEAVRLATCGPDRARFARAVTRSSSSDVVSQRAGSQQWRLRSSIGEGEKLRAERVSRRLLVLRSARPEDQQHARVLSTKPRTQHGGVVSCPQNSERSRARAQESRHPSPSTQLRRWTRRSGLCVSGARWTPSSAASTPGCGCR